MTTHSLNIHEHPAADLADRVGRREIADAVGVGLTAVSNAVVRGSFPSSWFFAVKSICDSKDIECPPALFSMKRAGHSQNVDGAATCQGEAAE